MCVGDTTILLNRASETIKNKDPISTCNPWNPVAMKKVDPKAESAMENVASMYSNAWHPVKIAPSITVRIRAVLALLTLYFNIS